MWAHHILAQRSRAPRAGWHRREVAQRAPRCWHASLIKAMGCRHARRGRCESSRSAPDKGWVQHPLRREPVVALLQHKAERRLVGHRVHRVQPRPRAQRRHPRHARRRGQCVQFSKSPHGVLEDFVCTNLEDSSWTEDNLSAWYSPNVTIRRGLIDGNNSPTGVAVMYEHSLGLTQDVDAIHQGDGCFSGYDVKRGERLRFERVGCHTNHCEGWAGRGVPTSDSLVFAAGGGVGYAMGIEVVNSRYWNLCNPNHIFWSQNHNEGGFAYKDAREENSCPARGRRSPCRGTITCRRRHHRTHRARPRRRRRHRRHRRRRRRRPLRDHRRRRHRRPRRRRRARRRRRRRRGRLHRRRLIRRRPRRPRRRRRCQPPHPPSPPPPSPSPPPPPPPPSSPRRRGRRHPSRRRIRGCRRHRRARRRAADELHAEESAAPNPAVVLGATFTATFAAAFAFAFVVGRIVGRRRDRRRAEVARPRRWAPS